MAAAMDVSVRRAEAEDAESVNTLIADELSTVRRRFGAGIDVAGLIESSYLSVTAVNEVGEVVGFAAFSDAPTVNYVAEDWLKWFQRASGADDCVLANTVWLSLFVATPPYDLDVAENIIRTAFTTLNDTDYLLLLLPRALEIFSPLAHSFEEVPIVDATGADELDYDGEFSERTVFCCNREVFIPTLTIRNARVEDHDDLVPIFNSQSEVLTELYGEFFIAELIEAQNDTTKALVAEVDGRAVGLMSLTNDIKLDVLQQCFELAPYNNLMQMTRSEQRAAEAEDRAAGALRRDWLALLHTRAAEVEEIFTELGGDSEVVNMERLASALNRKGVEWSYTNRRKRGLGDQMCADLGLEGEVLSRDALDEAVGNFAQKRADQALRRGVFTWYKKHDGRAQTLRAFSLAANYEAKEKAKDAAVAEATAEVGPGGDDEEGKKASADGTGGGEGGDGEGGDGTGGVEVALGDLAAVLTVLVREAGIAYGSAADPRGIGDDLLDLLGLDAAIEAERAAEAAAAAAAAEAAEADGGEEGAEAAAAKDVTSPKSSVKSPAEGKSESKGTDGKDGDDGDDGDAGADSKDADDSIIRVSRARLVQALDEFEDDVRAGGAIRVALLGPPGSGRRTMAKRLADDHGVAVIDVGELIASTVPPAEDEESESESEDEGKEEGKEADEEAREAAREAKAAAKAQARQFTYAMQDLVSRLRESDCDAGWVLCNLPTEPARVAELAAALSAARLGTRAVVLSTTDRIARGRKVGKDDSAAAAFDAELSDWKKNGAAVVAALTSAGGYGTAPEDRDEFVAKATRESAVRDAISAGTSPGRAVTVDASGSPNEVAQEMLYSFVDAGILRPPEDVRDEAAAATDAAAAAEDEGDDQPTPNAFAVTLFCLDELFDSRAADFLDHAFAAFPDRDYCLLTLPHASPETPLLGRFALASPKPSSTFSHVLYLAHRASMLAPRYVTVRRADASDRLGLSSLLSGVESQNAIMAAVTRADEELETPLTADPTVVALVAECQEQVIGVVVMSAGDISEQRVDTLRSSFELDRYLLLAKTRLRAQADLLHFSINPVFASSSRFVLRQAMRLYGKTVVYYPLRADDVPAPILEEFVQVRPRHRPEKAGSGGVEADVARIGSGELAASARGSAEDDRHALFFLTRKLMSEPKLVNNARIVVVGASDTGISFLETLLMVAYIRFTNVTLISPGGLPQKASDIAGKLSAAQASAPWTTSPEYRPLELERLALESRIRVIDARVTEIDRDAKAVVLPDDSIVPYDTLVITAGLQDQTAARMGADRADAWQLAQRVFTVADSDGNRYLEAATLELARDAQAGAEDLAVVYGDAIESLSAINALLARGVPGANIVHIRPGHDPIIEDVGAATLVSDAMAAAGVTTRTRSRLVQMQGDEDGGGVTIVLEDTRPAEEEPVRQAVRAALVVTADTPDVDGSLFAAVNGSGLPYDGRLVVDHKFRTTQHDIYAGGSIAKFARRYRAPHWIERYNAREAGAALGYAVLSELDPLMSAESGADGEEEVRGPGALQRFVLPRKTVAVVPGSLLYLHVALATVDMGAAGRELVTNVAAADSDNGHSHCTYLRLDRYGRLASLLYCGSDRVEVSNLSRLVGRHSGFMNGLERDFDGGAVKDLIVFFRLDWAYAVYHDLFDYLCLELRESLADDDHLQALLQATWEDVDKGGSDTFLRKQRDQHVGPYGSRLHPTTRKKIEAGVLDFLRANKALLPMYFLPSRTTDKK